MTVGKLTRNAVFARGNQPPRPEELLSFYVGEIELQCSFALASFGELVERIDRQPSSLAILAYAHMLLIFGGNVSKLLFPGMSKHKIKRQVAEQRSEFLRNLCGLENVSHLKRRSLRDHLEHFDERLDRQLGATRGIISPFLIAAECPKILRLDDGREFDAHFLRCLDTSRLVFSFLDQEFELRPFVAELQQVQAAARRWLEAQQPLPLSEGGVSSSSALYWWQNR